MKKLPLVALVGATNAGKSSLFNRLARLSRENGVIVAREAGTTRDSIFREIDGKFILVDTAGLKNPEDDFELTIQEQVEDAISAADLIILVKDATEFAGSDDKILAKKILKSRKPVILALNKIDLKERNPREEFLRLGISDICEISAEHNQNIAKLRDEIEEKLKNDFGNLRENAKNSARKSDLKNDENSAKESLKIALIGRPNVGKSHLFNTLSKKQQAVVADVAGTTRDINRVKVKFSGRNLEFLDTAGVRRNGKIAQGIEKFSVLRTLAAIDESDICLLIIDSQELATALDQKLAGIIAEQGKGLIIVVSKWDLVREKIEKNDKNSFENDENFAEKVDFKNLKNSEKNREKIELNKKFVQSDKRKFDKKSEKVDERNSEKFAKKIPQTSSEIIAKIKNEFDFTPWAPLIFTSAKTGQNVAKIFEIATKIAAERTREIPTRKLNEILAGIVAKHPPAGFKNTHPKFRYVVQTDVNPPWFVIFGANFKFIHWSYKRYLENNFRGEFGFAGTPIKFSFRDEKQIRENKLRENKFDEHGREI